MRYTFLLVLFLTLFLQSCKKGEGVGGKATIQGKVFVHYYNSTGTAILNKFYAPDEDVYIVYGDNDFYDDRVATHYDGTFRFEYLRPGKYTIFVYSKDFSGIGPDSVVLQKVEISGKKDILDIGDIVIKDN